MRALILVCLLQAAVHAQEDCNSNSLDDHLEVAPFAGSALLFDGDDDRVEFGDDSAYEVTDAITIEAWICPTGPGSDDEVGGIIVNKEGEYELARMADGTIGWALATPGGWLVWNPTEEVAAEFEWAHVAITYDGSNVRTYLNGEEANSVAVTGDIGDTFTEYNDLWIGSRQGPWTQDFDGLIDEVRIWDVALSEEDIADGLYAVVSEDAEGLILHASFDEGDGDTADGGTITGATWQDVTAECYRNGIPDECDIEDGLVEDSNENGIPDECEPFFIRGDCSGNGTLDLGDAIFLLSWIFLSEAEPTCEKACDVSDGDEVDLVDALLVLDYLFASGPAPEEPFPDCGLDVNEDDLGCASFEPCQGD